MAVIGVDEHCWRHTRRGEKYVTVIIDLTPVRDGAGPARLPDMVDGRSKMVSKTWLDRQSTTFRAGIEVVAMDGFTGSADVIGVGAGDASLVRPYARGLPRRHRRCREPTPGAEPMASVGQIMF